jgi:CRISPR-associated protein Cas5d
MPHPHYSIQMEIAGKTAMWTRADTGDCPVSYPAPTYSATKAMFESVLWGPAIEITPTKVEICSPIQYHAYYTNYGGPLRKNKHIKEGNNYQLLATVLIDVCYRVYAQVKPNPNKNGNSLNSEFWKRSVQWLEWDKQWNAPWGKHWVDKKSGKDKTPKRAKNASPAHAYQEIFERRLRRGQCYSVPFLGWKEFTPSYFGEFRENTQTQSDLQTIKIPSMLREIFSNGYDTEVSYLYDQNIVIKNGVLEFGNESKGE